MANNKNGSKKNNNKKGEKKNKKDKYMNIVSKKHKR